MPGCVEGIAVSREVAEVTGLLKYVDGQRAAMLELLERVVNIDSGSRDVEGVGRVASIFASHLEASGFKVSMLPGRSYGDHVYGVAGSGGPSILLMDHMDTVFPRGTAGERPFRLDEHSQRVYGPGVVDSKGGIVVLLHAVRALAEHPDHWNAGQIRVLLNADEEPGSPESREYLRECLDGVSWAFVFEHAEPSPFTFATRRKGVGVYHLSAEGKAAHAGAHPELGANAIMELVEQLCRINRLADAQKGTTVNVGTISGGTEAYVVPDKAMASIDFRVPNRSEQLRIEQHMSQIAMQPVVKGTRIGVEGSFHRPPMAPLEGLNQMKAAIRAASEELGVEPGFNDSVMGGVTDGNLIVQHGVPCIDQMGPGGTGSHSVTEYADVATFPEKVKLAALAIEYLLSRKPASHT